MSFGSRHSNAFSVKKIWCDKRKPAPFHHKPFIFSSAMISENLISTPLYQSYKFKRQIVSIAQRNTLSQYMKRLFCTRVRLVHSNSHCCLHIKQDQHQLIFISYLCIQQPQPIISKLEAAKRDENTNIAATTAAAAPLKLLLLLLLLHHLHSYKL